MKNADGSCHIAPSLRSLGKKITFGKAIQSFGMGSTGMGEGDGMTSWY